MPLILRTAKAAGTDENELDFRPLFNLVGDCYVDGIMDREMAPKVVDEYCHIFPGQSRA